MLLQPTISTPPLHHHHPSLPSSSSSSYSLSFPPGPFSPAHLKPITAHKSPAFITCSSAQEVHSYGARGGDKKTVMKWNGVYRKISMMENPELGPCGVLEKCETEGKMMEKWELSRIVKELRKYKKFKLSLEVYEWMADKPKRFRITTSDTAIHLDLIAKVQGITAAEEYFKKLPDGMKDNRIYGSLLNAYVRAKMKENAESLINKMKNRGYANHSLPYNVIMTLYMNLSDYEKVDSMVSEMMEKRISFDIYTYNIWISSCGSRGSLEKMEQAYEQMKQDASITPTWTTFSTMATMYIRLEQPEKAEDCLKKLESRIVSRDRTPYHYLLSLYGSVGNKDEVLRVWNSYKSLFQNLPNLSYQSVISSLVRMGHIEAAEEIYESWLSIMSTYDPRIGNLLLGWYVRKGLADKAESFFNKIIEVGGKPNSMTWEILAEGHIKDRNISEALSSLKNAAEIAVSKNWRPKPVTVSLLLKLCEEEADTSSKEAVMEILKKLGCLENEKYMACITSSDEPLTNNGSAIENSISDDNEVGTEMLLSQLHMSL